MLYYWSLLSCRMKELSLIPAKCLQVVQAHEDYNENVAASLQGAMHNMVQLEQEVETVMLSILFQFIFINRHI